MKRNLSKRGALLLLAQFCAVALLLVLLFVLVGCALPGGTTPPAEPLPTTDVPAPATTAVPSTAEAPVTTEAPVTEAPTEVPTEAPTAPAEPEPVDPLSLLGEVDAVEWTATYDDGWSRTYTFALPCLLADTEGARAINADIEDRFGDVFRYAKEHMEADDFSDLGSLQYRGVVWEDVLSVVITKYEYFDWTDYAVYCYEVPTGRWLTTPLLLERMGFSEEDFLAACRTRFHDRFVENNSNIPEEYYEDAGYYSQLEAQTGDEYVNLELMAYPDHGDVVAVAPIVSLVGPAYYYTPIPLGLGGPLSLLGEVGAVEWTETYDDDSSRTYSYALPCILADTEGARAINADVEGRFGDVFRIAKEHDDEDGSFDVDALEYRSGVWEDVLTVIVTEEMSYAWTDYAVYCYETSTGRWLTTAMLLERMGISEEEFLDVCRETFRQTFINQYRESVWTDEDLEKYGYHEALEQADSDRYVNMDLMAYPDANGRLVVIAPIVSLVGAGLYYQVLHLDLGAK